MVTIIVNVLVNGAPIKGVPVNIYYSDGTIAGGGVTATNGQATIIVNHVLPFQAYAQATYGQYTVRSDIITITGDAQIALSITTGGTSIVPTLIVIGIVGIGLAFYLRRRR